MSYFLSYLKRGLGPQTLPWAHHACTPAPFHLFFPLIRIFFACLSPSVLSIRVFTFFTEVSIHRPAFFLTFGGIYGFPRGYGGQRMTLGVVLQELPILILLFFETGSPTDLELIN